MDWTIGKHDHGKWPFRVLSSNDYLGLLDLLTEGAIDWSLSAERQRRRGPKGNPHGWSIWGPSDPITETEVSSKLAKGSIIRFQASYTDDSILRTNLISNYWLVLSQAPDSMAHGKPGVATEYVRKHARWWPGLGIAFLLSMILTIVPVVVLWIDPNVWTISLSLAASALAYLLTWPHRGPAIADRLVPFPVPRVVVGTINLTSAAGALLLIIITAAVTKYFSGT